MPQATDAYEDVLADDDVTALYISNGAADHARWAIAAPRAGKHVLCGKPIAISAHQAATIAAEATSSGCLVMEGSPRRFHPLYRCLKTLVASRRSGAL